MSEGILIDGDGRVTGMFRYPVDRPGFTFIETPHDQLPDVPMAFMRHDGQNVVVDGTGERAKRILKQAAREEAETRRHLVAATDRLEQREAQVARALSILTRVAEGLVQHAGYNPVADGVVTSDDIAFMRRVRDVGGKIGEALDAEKAIDADIESGNITDEQAIRRDGRWPQP